jgi:hypothetical protein
MTIGAVIPQLLKNLDVDLGKLEWDFTAWVVERSRRCAEGFRTDPEYWRVIGEWQMKRDEKKTDSRVCPVEVDLILTSASAPASVNLESSSDILDR